MLPTSHFWPEDDLHRYETLLQMAGLVARPHDLDSVLREVCVRLRQAISFQLITFAFHDPGSNTLTLWYREIEGRSAEHSSDLLTEQPPHAWVWQNQQPLVIHDIQADSRIADPHPLIRAGVNSFCCLPLTTAMKRVGTLGIGFREELSCKDGDLRFLERVAELVALAIENAMAGDALNWEKERLQMLLEVSSALLSNLDLPGVFPAISASIRKVIRQDYAAIFLHEEESHSLRRFVEDVSAASAAGGMPSIFPVEGSVSGSAFLRRQTTVRGPNGADGETAGFAEAVGEIRRICAIPLLTRTGPVGTLSLGSKEDSAFGPQDVNLLQQIAGQIAIALDNARAYREIAALKDKLAEEKSYLQGEIRSKLNFEEVIGESPALKRVLDTAKIVAPSDATVLLLGETGTGKELIGHAIHRLSHRKDAPFIKMNCAAIPTGLLESELFGHEKGAFTGAISQKAGRLELADKGTLFLDEIGDIPLEVQPKLLRVLQDQEFERLGSTRTIRINIRLIAATNCDLAAAVADKQFRSDLYYRLNVFPIHIPSLRERKEDIPLLVRYFVQKISRRMNRRIDSISEQAMDVLCNWSWPGNVRELENFIERSVILSRGPALNVPVAELQVAAGPAGGSQTLQNLERGYILRVLRETGGVIGGAKGAAARLGLKRTTLQSRLHRMGISRPEFVA